ncbi:hypothetical protein TNCV_1580771 [Trichonephila clavipes]|nr:hypothetical protein TNCV_1580771 [Trichonephila clavipes]
MDFKKFGSDTAMMYLQHALLIAFCSGVDKNVKSGKGPFTPSGLLNLVKRFEFKLESWRIEHAPDDHTRKKFAPCIADEMEAIASKHFLGPALLVAARRLWLTTIICPQYSSSFFQLYPYKLQSCHELLAADTAQGKHLRSGPSLKWNRIPPGFFEHLVDR